MIKKTILIFILLMTYLGAKSVEVDYKATFGIFGKVGSIYNKVTTTKRHYRIDTTVKLSGLAKLLLGGQKEHYTSKGHLEHGLMVSDVYTMETIKGSSRKLKTYHIDHKKHRVVKHYQKWKEGKLIRDTTTTLDFYAKNDLLTLYFNMDRAIKQKGKVYTMKAVGLEKQKGIVEVTVPNESQTAPYKKDLGKSANWYAKALIVQKNFKKNKGDILLSVSEDGFIQKAVIKDIVMYGDAKLIRTK